VGLCRCFYGAMPCNCIGWGCGRGTCKCGLGQYCVLQSIHCGCGRGVGRTIDLLCDHSRYFGQGCGRGPFQYLYMTNVTCNDSCTCKYMCKLSVPCQPHIGHFCSGDGTPILVMRHSVQLCLVSSHCRMPTALFLSWTTKPLSLQSTMDMEVCPNRKYTLAIQ